LVGNEAKGGYESGVGFGMEIRAKVALAMEEVLRIDIGSSVNQCSGLAALHRSGGG